LPGRPSIGKDRAVEQGIAVPIEINPLNFSRQALSGNVFDDVPPPLPDAVKDGTTGNDGTEFPGLKMRACAGRTPGRARSGSTSSRSSSRSSSPPAFIAPLAPDRRVAMSLDDHLPWDKELANIKDPGYATPPEAWTVSPEVRDSGRARANRLSETLDCGDGRHSAPRGGRQPRPQSTGGRPLSPVPVSGLWMRGGLSSPVTADRLFPPQPSRPDSAQSGSWGTSSSATLPHLYMQTATFGDPGTLSTIDDIGFTSPSLMARLWRRVTYPPRALLSACRELAQRLVGWFSGFR